MNEQPVLSLRVASRRLVAEDILAFDLVESNGALLPAFEPGAHINLHLPGGHIRSYSLYGRPDERDRYRIAVLRAEDGRGGSKVVHDALQNGDVVMTSAPANCFALVEAPMTWLFAGGIGITPLICMAWSLWLRGRRFALHYCARSALKMAFRDELANLPFADSVHLHFNDDVLPLDPALVLRESASEAHVYTCGPAGFIDWIEQAARSVGIAGSQLHHERFSGETDSSGPEFEVYLATSKRRLPVRPGETMLEAITRAGISVNAVCEQGVCGACLTPVLDGKPDHRDQVLTDEEREANRLVALCCSRSFSACLTLDL